MTTQDLGLVGALMVNGLRPARTTREGIRLAFVYTPSPELDELCDAYAADALMVPASSYSAVVRHLSQRARHGR